MAADFAALEAAAKKARCRTCRYFTSHVTGEPIGWCNRFPDFEKALPEGHFCGEHQAWQALRDAEFARALDGMLTVEDEEEDGLSA